MSRQLGDLVLSTQVLTDEDLAGLNPLSDDLSVMNADIYVFDGNYV